jgi:hypothetical protein
MIERGITMFKIDNNTMIMFPAEVKEFIKKVNNDIKAYGKSETEIGTVTGFWYAEWEYVEWSMSWSEWECGLSNKTIKNIDKFDVEFDWDLNSDKEFGFYIATTKPQKVINDNGILVTVENGVYIQRAARVSEHCVFSTKQEEEYEEDEE